MITENELTIFRFIRKTWKNSYSILTIFDCTGNEVFYSLGVIVFVIRRVTLLRLVTMITTPKAVNEVNIIYYDITMIRYDCFYVVTMYLFLNKSTTLGHLNSRKYVALTMSTILTYN